MTGSDLSPDPTRKFGAATVIAGILLIALGAVGFFVPYWVSLGTALFVGWLLLIGGGVWAYHTFQYHRRSLPEWFKPVLLVVAGGMMLYSPAAGVAAIGMLLAVYLLLDAYGSFSMAHSIYPDKGWGWMSFNGVVSVLLALLFLIGWPATSLWLVGLYVSISLFFDGVALIALSLAARSS